MGDSTEDVLVTIGTSLDEAGLLKLEGELKKVGVNLKKTGDDGKLSLEKVKTETDKAGKSFVEFAAKIAVAYAAISNLTKAWLTQAKADAQLELAVKNNTTELSRQGKTVKEVTKDFQKFAQEREKLTNIDDAETQQLQKLIVSFGEVPSNVNRVTAAFQDLATGTGKSATELVNKWKKVGDASVTNESLVSDLREAGVMLNATDLEGLNIQQRKEVILTAINGKYGNQAEIVGQAEGAVGKFNVSVGNLVESMGKLVFDILGPMFKGLQTIIEPFIELPGIVKLAIIALVGLVGVFATATVAGTTFSVVMMNVIKSLGPIGWAVTAIGALASVVGLFSSSSDRSAAALKNFSNKVRDLDTSISKYQDDMSKVVKSNEDLLANLKTLTPGTSAYESEIRALLASNPKLANSNINLSSSYDDVLASLNAVNTAAGKLAMLNSAKDMVSDARGLMDTYKEVNMEYTLAKYGKISRSDDQIKELDLRQQALKDQIVKGLAQVKYVDSLLGTTNYEKMIKKLGPKYSGDKEPLLGGLVDAADANPYKPKSLKTYKEYDRTKKTSDTTAATKPIYDIEAARIAAMTDSYAKQRVLIDRSFQEEMKKIEESANDEDEKLLARTYVQEKAINDLNELQKKQDEELKQQRIDSINTVADHMSNVMSIATSAVGGDWKNMIGGALSMIPGVGQALSGVFSTAVELFDGLIETSAEKMEKRLQRAIDRTAARLKSAERVEDVEDGTNTKTLTARRDALKANIEQIKSDLGLTGEYTEEEWAQVLNAIEKDGLNGLKAIDSASNRLANDLRGKGVTNRVKYLAGISDSLWDYLDELEDTEPQLLSQPYIDQINDIQDLVETGEMSQEEATKKQIELYDQAIAALQGVAGAEDLIIQLKKDRYNLEKGITEETQKQLLTEEQMARNAKIKALEDDIKYGRRKDDYAANKELSDLYVQQLASMTASGLAGTDIYRSYEDKLRELSIGNVGQAGYTALSGSGSNVNLGMTGRKTPAPIIRVDGGSSSTANTYLNANLNLPPDLVNWLLRSVNSQGSRSF